MSSVKPPDIRFSGYRLVKHGKNGKAQLYLPGYQDANVKAEAIFPHRCDPEEIALEPKDGYWVSKRPVPLGTAYRFKVNDQWDQIPARMSRPGQGQARDVVFKKNGSVWEPEQPAPVRQTVTYRIPLRAQTPRLRAEKCVPGQPPVPVPLSKDGHELVFSTDEKAPEGTTYHLTHGLDCQEVIHDADYGAFNLVARQGLNAPQRSVVIADVFQDSILPARRLQEMDTQARKQKKLPGMALKQTHLPILPMVNHFTQRAGAPGGGHEAGLTELMPDLQRAGFTGLLFKPFIGGDTVSSHGYWTVDPYVLNHSFRDKAAFRAFLADSLKRDMKIFADGAFVNQGLNGVQMMANMAHGFSSPYWRWLKYGDEHQVGGPPTYPSLAHNQYVFGLLPTKMDAQTGERRLDYDRFAFRVINDPAGSNGPYDTKRPTFIELYDPRLEKPDGSLKPKSPALLDSQDSVQKLRFPISVDELAQKRKTLKKGSHSPEAEKKLFSQWRNFRLDVASADDSGVKWDGQVDVAMLNTRNPEVVNYLDGAVGYWSRMVMNAHINTVTRALVRAGRRQPQAGPADLLKAVTKNNPEDAEPIKVLPPVKNPELDMITDEEAKSLLAAVKPDCDDLKSGETFARRLIQEVPMDVLPLPVLFKATLSYPGLQPALRNQHRTLVANFIDTYLLGPLSHLPVLGRYIDRWREGLFPASFEHRLGEKMEQIFGQLQPKTQKKLRYGLMQSQLADQLGERLYLSLLLGVNLDEVRKLERDPKALEDAFYAGMPANILKADPYTAAKLLPRLLKNRLDKLKPVHVANQIEGIMNDLDPQMAALAQEAVQRRELGLNWRIDAAKDVADMNRIYEAEPEARPALFQEEVKFMQKFWDQVVKSMRKPFPRTAIIAELTDFDQLSNHNGPVAAEAMKQLLGDKTFNGTPNMNYLYSGLLQLINYAQRPDEYGNTQMTPGEFVRNIQAMSEAVPASALHQYQNLTSSHDYPTTSHAMLVNPALFTMDLQKWWGLKDDFIVATDELRYKPCFDEARQALIREHKINNPDQVLQALSRIVTLPALRDRLQSEALRNFYDQASKESDTNRDTCLRPTPQELKAPFVRELFRVIKPAEIGLKNREQMDALEELLESRMSEPSETKAMRGAIVNAELQLNWREATAEERQQAERALWQALDVTADQWKRHFGYQPLDIAINHVFENLDHNQLPKSMKEAKNLEEWKAALYFKATQPVMNNLKKVFAVQNALPGNPSVYMPDLFAQGGSEWTKNIFCQNRNLIRVDKLQNKQFRRFFNEVGRIFQTRSRPDLQALNDGAVLPVTADDVNGVLPIVRDNGKQQVVVLVNTGLPQALDWNHKAGVGPHYESVTRNIQPELRNYRPDLSELRLPDGTRYHDVHTNEAFVLRNGRLVRADNPDEGLTLTDWRMLVRDNPPSKEGDSE